MTPEIIDEDNAVLVINKPAGLIVHSDGRTPEPSVAEWVLEKYPQTARVGEPWLSPQGETILRPGIVHRLDRNTSGVMIIAKSQEAYRFLKRQFQERIAKKRYCAFVYGHPKAEQGMVEKEIVRLRTVPPRWGVKKEGEDKKHRHAITEWKVLARSSDRASGEAISLLEARPQTGRTHQIRVHFKYLNHPIICDPLYAIGRKSLLGFERTALHARSLTIATLEEAQKTFLAPFPDDFMNAFSEFPDFNEDLLD